MPKIYVYLWFDIEDYVTKETDDLPLKAFNILKKYNVPVTCKLVSEKVRELIENGRRDVISAISEYDIGYHSDTHSRHPTIYEYLADLDVISGATEFKSREERGLGLIKEVFKRSPSCYGHPGSMWAPHVYPALPEMGIQLYLDETDILDLDNQPYWYCGVLNLNGAGQNSMYFDYTFEEPNGIDALKSKFDLTYERLHKEKGGAISICFHLHTAVNKKFWDEINFAAGENREKKEYKRPPVQPTEVTQRAWRNFEELIRYISSFRDVQWITGSEAIKIYQRPPGVVLGNDQLTQIVKHFLSSASYAKGEFGNLSPSEGFYVVTKCLTEYAETGTLPERIMTKEPLGPIAPARSKGRKTLMTKDFLATVRAASGFLDSERSIPTSLKVGDYAELSPHDYMATACKVLDLILSGGMLPDEVILRRGRPPQVEHLNAAGFEKACSWVVLPRSFKAPKILEQARLQAWTLKPAVPKSDEPRK